MNKKTINKAKLEAKRFLAAVKTVEDCCDDGDNFMLFMNGSKETGALRRSSMDLTRALAEMRK